MTDSTALDFTWDSLKSVLWQYDNSPVLQALLQNRMAFYNESTKQFFTDYIHDVLDLNTANTFGLAIWGSMLGIDRPTYINSDGDTVSFSDDTYRMLLKAKILRLNKRPTIPNINEFLITLFGKGSFASDPQNMTLVTYTIATIPTAEVEAISRIADFFPRPAGVGINIQPIDYQNTFGFNGSGLQPFNQGNFIVTGWGL